MFNEDIRPMLLKEIDKPFLDKNYFYELKFDGIRAIIYAGKNSFKIKSRNGKDITYLFPELKEIQNLVFNNKVIFDGEIVAFKEGRPSFSLLQKRMHLKNKEEISRGEEEIKVVFVVFDILYQNKSLIEEVLIKRRKILDKYPDTDYFIKTKIYDEGIKLFKAVKKLGLEGIVAKEKLSKYYPNKRVDGWLKIKNIKDDMFYVLGYTFNKEKYSLYLGELKNDSYYYVGKVSASKSNKITQDIKKLKTNKYKIRNLDDAKITYVKPIKKVLVKYLEKTKEGKLRHASLK